MRILKTILQHGRPLRTVILNTREHEGLVYTAGISEKVADGALGGVPEKISGEISQ